MTSASFLPPYLQSIPNRRFLKSTLDLLVSQPQINRFDGYIGRTFYNGALQPGNYLLANTPLLQNYQLEASFVTTDANQNITNVSNFLDLLNSAANNDAITSAWNRLLTGNMYSWEGFTDLDKIVNYTNYCWMSPANLWFWNNPVQISPVSSVGDIIGQESYTDNNGITLLSGMVISFPSITSGAYSNSKWIVEGVGIGIVLIPSTNLLNPLFALDQNNPPDYITIRRDAAI